MLAIAVRHWERPTTRSTPVPGHVRAIRRVNLDESRRGWGCSCSCGWQGHGGRTEYLAVAEHTAHKVAVRSGEWAAAFESEKRADLLARAEPHGLIEDVQARIDERNRTFVVDLRRR